MSNKVDDRIVQLRMENGQLQRGVKTSLDALNSLKKGLDFKASSKNLSDLQSAAGKFTLQGLAQGVDALVSKFNTLSVIGITAITNLANRAVDAGLQMAKSLTIDPIKSGFDEYELKMGSIQTILSNTARYGTKLPEVTKNLEELNAYADKTIYNFGDMTKNIGLFTNAGIRVGDATSMIKGFSNEAAASGTSAQGAASAAYQLSQALSAGKITLMDWRSLQTVGMGNKNMQHGILEIADAMGTLQSKGLSSKEVQKDFNGSLEKGWLTADVMSKYLKIMAGDMSEAEMKTLGLSKATISTFKTQQKNAQDAATKVRTFSQLIGTLREGVGSGWAQSFDIILGDFNKATELFTSVNDTLGKMIENVGVRRNKVLSDWAKMGGRTAAIDAIANSFKAIMAVIKPVQDAFREIFPPATGKQLADISKAIAAFTKNLILTKEQSADVKTFFKALFSVLRIGVDVVSGIVRYFASFISILGGGTGGAISFAGGIGEVILKLTDWIRKGDKIGAFFDMLIKAREATLAPIVAFVGKIVEAFGLLARGDTAGFFNKLRESTSSVADFIEAIRAKIENVIKLLGDFAGTAQTKLGSLGNKALQPLIDFLGQVQTKFEAIKGFLSGLKFDVDTSGLKKAAGDVGGLEVASDKLKSMWEGLGEGFAQIREMAKPIMDSVGKVFETVAQKVTDYIKNMDFQDAVALLNTGFFIAMYQMLRKFLSSLDDIVGQFGDLMGSISGTFDQLTSSLKAMQQNVQASIILKIAVALALLAGAVYVLSKIDAEGLKKALITLSILFAQLVITLTIFSKLDFKGGMTRAAGALVLLAVAIKILASAMEDLSVLDFGALMKGLIGVGGLLVALALFQKFAAMEKGGVKAGVGLILTAVAIKVLADSVEKIGKMDTGEMIKGILALGVMLGALAVMVRVMNNTTGIVQASVGLLILSAALMALYGVMQVFARLDWKTFLWGLATMAGTLVAVALALQMMPKNMPGIGAGLLLVSGALLILSGVMKIMAGMSWEEIAKGLVAIGGALLIIAIGTNAMTGAIAGAQALLLVSAALAILTPILLTLGSMDLASVGIALLALAGTFTVLGLAGLLLGPLIPVLSGLATVIGLLGLAMLAAGVGFLAFGIGFSLLAAAGTAGVAVLIAAFTGILNLIPLFMQQIGLGLIAFAKVISDAGPVIVNALTTILLSLLRAIDRVAPKFFDTMGRLVMGMVNKIAELTPQIAKKGLEMIVALLDAVAKKVPEIIKHATKIVTNFLDAIAKAVPDIVEAGYKMVLDILDGLTKSVNNNSEAIGRKGGELAVALIRGMVNGIRAGGGEIWNAAQGMADRALSGIKSFLGIASPSKEFTKVGKWSVEGLSNGMTNYGYMAERAAEGVGHDTINAMRKSIEGLDEIVNGNVDLRPTISPVLDLSSVKAEATKIGTLVSATPIKVAASLETARNAAAYSPKREVLVGAETQTEEISRSLVFNQYNSSPKALDEATLYRQTNNIISKAKKELP